MQLLDTEGADDKAAIPEAPLHAQYHSQILSIPSDPCRPDKYNTSQLVSFLQQLLTHGGYYDDNLDFINIDRVQVGWAGGALITM
jgi:hypothetical protein